MKSKYEKELEAQKKRAQALQYLNSQGQSVSSNKIIFDKRESERDNTLALVRERSVSELKKSQKDVESLQNRILQQQNNIKKESLFKSNAPVETENVPDGWKVLVHPATCQKYYVNISTGEKSFTNPKELSCGIEKASPINHASSIDKSVTAFASNSSKKDVASRNANTQKRVREAIDLLDPSQKKVLHYYLRNSSYVSFLFCFVFFSFLFFFSFFLLSAN